MEYKNAMQKPRIDKLVLNIGVGSSGEELGRAEKLLQKLTSKTPVRTMSKHKIPGWNIRKREPIGCKVTLRGKDADEMLKRGLYAKDNQLGTNNFDESGNVAFGVQEYIDIKDIKYDPDIGIYGLNFNVTMEKPGYRVKRRSYKQSKVSKKHNVTKEEAITFMKENFGVEIEE
ncbi:MAG: 50S ribosomal protein L5 [Candidatus Altiarchaeota archaeon]|nr:50S ribosomal protein L5 [Candidatus Altiarchaeota archaeon]